jgi:U32 family peptidase
LNAANVLTALELLNFGLQRVTASYDINANAITEMSNLLGERSRQLEVTVHAKIPIFHTEYCVFARFLSKGNSYLDCGHVCTRNNIHLRDQSGADNLVLADMGCRNTVFRSEAQSGCRSVPAWQNAGIGAMRIELVDESKEDSQTVILQYLNLLSGSTKASDVWDVLSQIKDSNGRVGGVSLGSFNNKLQRRAGELSQDF